MTQHVAVITGASEGIGAALALELAKRGYRVALAARNRDKLEAVAEECTRAGVDALAVPTDVADEASCQELISRVIDHYGRIDALVNNAGISMSSRFDRLEDLGMLERLMRVNYLGAAYCTFYALPHLKRSQGLVVAVSSLQGKTGFPSSTGYAASKHAMQGFFDSLRMELANVDVLVVSPGAVQTEIHARKLSASGAVSHSGRDFSQKNQMTADECAEKIAKAMRLRKRDLVLTAGGKLAVAMKPFAPRFVDRQVARAVRDFYAE